MKRAKTWAMTPNGRVVACTACSWWVPVMGEDTGSAEKAFDTHTCADHPPLKNLDPGTE